MEGEITFYTQYDLDHWRPRPETWQRADHSPRGRLFAAWNENQRRVRNEHDRRQDEIEKYERARDVAFRRMHGHYQARLDGVGSPSGTSEEQADR